MFTLLFGRADAVELIHRHLID